MTRAIAASAVASVRRDTGGPRAHGSIATTGPDPAVTSTAGSGTTNRSAAATIGIAAIVRSAVGTIATGLSVRSAVDLTATVASDRSVVGSIGIGASGRVIAGSIARAAGDSAGRRSLAGIAIQAGAGSRENAAPRGMGSSIPLRNTDLPGSAK